jgi:hypothetical protein
MAKKPYQTKFGKLRVLLFAVIFISPLLLGVVSAQSSDFGEILAPLQTIYDLVKYAATVIAGLVMLFAGITYIANGADPGKREKAKSMVTYVFVGLMVIWAGPFIVDLILVE